MIDQTVIEQHFELRYRVLMKGIRVGVMAVLLACLMNCLGTAHARMASSEQDLYTRTSALPPTYVSEMTTADSGQWTVGRADKARQSGAVCDYNGGSYEVFVPGSGSTASTKSADCLASGLTGVGTEMVQVQYTATSGNVSSGAGDWLRLRVNQFYFQVSLRGYTNLDNSVTTNPVASYKTGLQQVNTLTLLEQGQNAYAYINGKFVSKDSNGLAGLASVVGLTLYAGDVDARIRIQKVQVTRPAPNIYASALGAQDMAQWQVMSSSQGSCGFFGSAYHVTENVNNVGGVCMAQATSFDNFVLNVTMTINTGSIGGIRFRANTNGAHYNLCFNRDGTYDLNAPSGTLFSGTAAPSVFRRGNGISNSIQLTAWQNTLVVLVNGLYLNSVTDVSSNASIGALGFFSIERNSVPTDVSFTGIYMRQPVMLYSSDLSAQDSSMQWDVATITPGGSCGFTGGSYRIEAVPRGYYLPCMAHASRYDNFGAQVDMTIHAGSGGGLIFRAHGSNAYRLRIGTDGSYDLSTQAGTLIPTTVSSAIKQGDGSTNRLRVLCLQNMLKLYVNDTYLAAITDASNASDSGELGFFAINSNNVSSNVNFSNLWILQ